MTEDVDSTESLRQHLSERLDEPVDAETAAAVEAKLNARVRKSAKAVRALARAEADQLAAANGGDSA